MIASIGWGGQIIGMSSNLFMDKMGMEINHE